MKRRKIAGVLLALLLFGGGCAALAAGGTSSDPLVTLGYLNGTYIPAVTGQMSARAADRTQAVYTQAEQRLQQEAEQLLQQAGGESGTVSGTLTLKREDRLSVDTGAGLVWLVGSARVTHTGTVIDVTDGSPVASGTALSVGHRYLVGEDTTAVFTVISEAAQAAVQGGARATYSTFDAMPFTDVKEGDWFCESVRYVYKHSLFNGVSGSLFSPEGGMNRAMLATVLYRLAGQPSVAGLQNPFTDVPAGQYYTDAVIWAGNKGIVTGLGNGIFDPNGLVSREQIAAMLYRYAGEYLGLPVTDRADLSAYPDQGETAAYARDAVSWMVAKGIIQGSGGKLLPRSTAQRCQVAAMLQRFSALL